jgi:hypothetical protein
MRRPRIDLAVLPLNPGFVGTVALSSARANPLMPDQTTAAPNQIVSLRLHRLFMGAPPAGCDGTTTERLERLH